MRFVAIILVFVFFLKNAYGEILEVLTVTPGPNQSAFLTNQNLYRYIGNPVTVLVTFSEQLSNPPDTAKIHVYRKGTATTFIETGAAITPSPNKIASQWLYTFKPLDDGDATIVFDEGAGTTGASQKSAAGSVNFVLDFLPKVSVTATTSPTQVQFTTLITQGFEDSENPVSVDFDKISVLNGFMLTSVSSRSLINVVQPFGYGKITQILSKNLVTDKWGQTNDEERTSVDFPAPSTAQAMPKAIRVIGLTPDNNVIRTGETVELAIDYNRAVRVVGQNPILNLNSSGNGPLAVALFSGISSDNTQLRFSYTILNGQRASVLDVVSLTFPAESAVVGANLPLDWIITGELPKGEDAGSLRQNFFYSVNVDASKPNPADIPGADKPSACGAGSGIALALGAGWLGVSLIRRRRAA